MIKQITLTEREIEILKFIQAEEGQQKLTAVIHDCITNYYKLQYFNKRYMNKGKGLEGSVVENLTPEQFCEKFGGRVKTEEGIDKCLLTLPSGSIYTIPLNMPEKIEAISKQYKIV